MRWCASVAAVVVALWVPSWAGFPVGTVVWLACGAALVGVWPQRVPAAFDRPRPKLGLALAAAIAVSVIWALVTATNRTLPNIFAGPPDPSHGDMLVIIDAAVTRFLAGGFPYVHYQVPWDQPLPYGPGLWLPYVIPHWLRMDARVLTLAAQWTIPIACGISGVASACRGRVLPAMGLAAVAAATALEPQMLAFHAVGHTQVYWPILFVFALLLAERRWSAACVVLGLLVASRTTMVAIVPVFFVTLHVRRELTLRRIALFAGPLLVLFGPFFVHGARGVIDAMFSSYLRVNKGLVWQPGGGARAAYGLTSMLLNRGLEQYVELVQLASLGIVYAAAWVRIRAGRPPEPWIALALLVFSMTTLWSVLYLFFDVWLFVAAGLAATAWPGWPRPWVRLGAAPAGAFLMAVCLVVIVAGHHPGSAYTIDVGTPASAPMTGGGFGSDECVTEAGRTFVWVEGTTARVRLPRAGYGPATIRVTLRAPTLGLDLPQVVTLLLNGHVLGRASVPDTWTDIVVKAGSGAWFYGFNVLDLQFAHAVARDRGTASAARLLSAAVDRVTIE